MFKLIKILLTIIVGAFILFSNKSNAQWKPFVEQYGEWPVDYTNPANTIKLQEQWIIKTKPSLDMYVSLVRTLLLCDNYVFVDSKEIKGDSVFVWQYYGVIKKGGMQQEFVITPKSPLIDSPEDFVKKIKNQFNYAWKSLTSDPTVSVQGVKVLNWRELFFYIEEMPKCEVVFTPGQICTFDVGSGTIKKN